MEMRKSEAGERTNVQQITRTRLHKRRVRPKETEIRFQVYRKIRLFD